MCIRDRLSTLALVICVLAIVWLLWRATRRDLREIDLVTALAATMLAAVVFGKVVSPQYLAWLLPLALLVPGRRGVVAASAFTLALPITQLVFPLLYRDMVERSAPLPVGLLLARNVLLIVALVAAWPGGAAGRTPASPPPGRRREPSDPLKTGLSSSVPVGDGHIK